MTDIKAAISNTQRAQSDASDPGASAWVNANAGTGKTHVLTLRVLRLLLNGTPPERILCLTYTKAGAAEMSKRVFDTLATWVTTQFDQLTKILVEILGRNPTHDELERARTLFTVAIETPGGLKVQTIHAFCERLLQRFPLEANVPPGFKILDDEKGRELKASAIEATLIEATATKSAPLGKALEVVIRYAADSNFDELLSKAIAERAWLRSATRIELGKDHDDFAAVENYLRGIFGVRLGVTSTAIERERAIILSKEQISDLTTHLSTGGKTDVKHAELLRHISALSDPSRISEILSKYFLTGENEPRASLMSKALSDGRPDLRDMAQSAQSRFATLTTELTSLTLIEATIALYRLAAAVLQRYTDAKRSSGALDFDDLIEKTTGLLSDRSATDWVLYKLDGGLDHILVDEAQDTSPQQWDIIKALAREFFSGQGAHVHRRTVFAVGDGKQSIYSFQGAEPEMFAQMGNEFAQLSADAKMPWRTVPLNLSFRTVKPILDAVDTVFSDPARTPGLTANNAIIPHIAKRFGQAGIIEIWPTETPADATDADPWQPLADISERAPATRLAERIADKISGWLQSRERLQSEDRPIRAGDIIILVRKRHPFAIPMITALKARHIPVAGSDRMALVDQIAVQDLLVLGDFLTLPEDDLALATVLKSPLFGLNDDDLLAIAHGRKATLWKSLLAHADVVPRYKPAAETLKRWRSKADFMPPFEFFSSVLDRDGGRTKMLHRLGPDAADAIDEFLDYALSYDDASPPSLTGFLTDIRAANVNVKRDMDLDRNEVRIMTVHGAKGLEAPIVFLPDTCTTASGGGSGARLLTLPQVARLQDALAPIVWQIKGSTALPVIGNATAARQARERDELNRLLYVAMTRARDRLYITGFEGQRARAQGCWYNLITDAIASEKSLVDLGDQRMGWRIVSEQEAKTEKPKVDHAEAEVEAELPDFARRRAPHEPQLTVPLAPSRLEPYAPDAEGEPMLAPKADPAVTWDHVSPLTSSEPNRFLRGTLTHALLQHLPSIALERRLRAAQAFVEKRGAQLKAQVRSSIVKETLAVLSSKDFAPLFGPNSRAEVAISAVIPRPRGSGPALRLSGQIDRLCVTDQSVLIVDYKTNRPPPQEVSKVADAYLYQLAAYVLALGEIYPEKPVRAALLWTDGPRLMEVPKMVIDNAIKRLWDLDVASLDGG